MVSYYPNILINGGLFPSACGPNFLTVFKGFKTQRVEAKRIKNFTKDKGLKIFMFADKIAYSLSITSSGIASLLRSSPQRMLRVALFLLLVSSNSSRCVYYLTMDEACEKNSRKTVGRN